MSAGDFHDGAPRAKCPLCFVDLDESQRLIRYCPNDHEKPWAMFVCTPDNLKHEIYCWRDECTIQNIGIPEGISLLHVGCEASNPFWNPTWSVDDPHKIDIPESVRLEFDDGLGRPPVLVTHWQVGALREAARIPDLTSRREMWFPQTLLRATFERTDKGLRSGTFVKLSGAKSVGKTILATMALSPRNLAATRYLGHYVYLPPTKAKTKPEEEFLGAIYPIQVLEAAGSTHDKWAPPSNPIHLNLKTLFLREYNSAQHAVAEPGNHRRGVVRTMLRILGEQLTGALRSPESLSRSASDSYTLALYDTAGEESERQDLDRIRRLDAHMDIVAVLLDATDLLRFEKYAQHEAGHTSSVPIAINRLLSVANARAATCLIVTKLDLAPENEEPVIQKKLAEMADSATSRPMGERELLADWLAQSRTHPKSRKNIVEEHLRKIITDLEKVHRVFFVWTENLNDKDLLPTAKGLLKFIAWCREGAQRETQHEGSDAASISR